MIRSAMAVSLPIQMVPMAMMVRPALMGVSAVSVTQAKVGTALSAAQLRNGAVVFAHRAGF